MFVLRYTLLYALILFVCHCDVLFKCVTVYECSKKPCSLLKQSEAVASINKTLLDDLYEEIKLQSSNRTLVLFEAAIKGFHSLKRLMLTDMKITLIEAGAFQDLPNLETLDLRRNLLEEIEDGVFSLLNMTQLFLQGNKIKRIGANAFDNMEYLEVVCLDNNMLTAVDPQWFGNTPNVQYISLRQNLIDGLPARAFNNVRGLHVTDDGDTVTTDIYLSKNRIKTIDPEAFGNFEVLGDLYLNSNKLKTLDARVFKSLKAVEVLSLAKNKLIRIDEGLLSSVGDIRELDVSFNKLNCLPYSIVSRVNKTILIGNKDFNCACLNKLKNRLKQNNQTAVVRFEMRNCAKKKQNAKKKRKKKKIKKRKQQKSKSE